MYDWKFGNPEFGYTKYYDEVEFFITLLSLLNPDIDTFLGNIHFPEYDYSFPVKKYNTNKLARMQNTLLRRIDFIIEDKYLLPNPGRTRCKLCSFRSEEAGGTGSCNHSVI